MYFKGLLGLGFALFCSSAKANCVDHVLPVSSAMARPTTPFERRARDLSLHKLHGLLPLNSPAITQTATAWSVPCDGMFLDDTSIKKILDPDGTLSPAKVAAVYQENHLKTIEARGLDEVVKPTLDEFKASTDFKTWTNRMIARSSVKGKTRRIYRSPVGHSPAISVSETLDCDNGNPNAAILETEVAIALTRNPEDWDFYAYNRAGVLVNYSTFPAGVRAAPDMCISCHYSSTQGTVSRFFP